MLGEGPEADCDLVCCGSKRLTTLEKPKARLFMERGAGRQGAMESEGAAAVGLRLSPPRGREPTEPPGGASGDRRGVMGWPWGAQR